MNVSTPSDLRATGATAEASGGETSCSRASIEFEPVAGGMALIQVKRGRLLERTD
jgi:hypothetical protein